MLTEDLLLGVLQRISIPRPWVKQLVRHTSYSATAQSCNRPICREILGNTVHLTLAAGASSVQTLETTLADSGNSVGTETVNHGWSTPEISVATTSNTKPRYPILALLKSDNVVSKIKGWRTESGILLAEPVHSRIHFTKEIAKYDNLPPPLLYPQIQYFKHLCKSAVS